MAGNRLGVLDGLRGIAIVLVVWFHIWQISWLRAPATWLQFIPETGFVGVHVFFFISGFVIVYPFVRAKLEGKPRPSWAHFAYRRAIKIVPSYVLSIGLMFLIGYQHVEQTGGVLRDVVTHLLFIHNWFANTYGSINGVLWTLGVEVQFYVVFPLLCYAFLRRPYWTFAGLLAIALIFRSAVVGSFYFLQLIEQLPAYLDFFACGMLTAYLYVSLRNHPLPAAAHYAATALAILGFAGLVALMESLFSIRYAHDGFAHWQVINRTWLALDCIAIGVGSLFAAPLWKRALANPLLVFFSIISYNWYIYHQVVARELWYHHLPPWVGVDPHADPHWQFWYSVIAFPATILVATIVTYAFERPLLRLEPQWLARLRQGSA
jgi:peptidoglycan/LPS O-acetylase OafA/YrhL